MNSPKNTLHIPLMTSYKGHKETELFNCFHLYYVLGFGTVFIYTFFLLQMLLFYFCLAMLANKFESGTSYDLISLNTQTEKNMFFLNEFFLNLYFVTYCPVNICFISQQCL